MGEWSPRGKNVLITGASSGIGRELALRYAALGANVVLIARRMDLLQELAQECSKHGIVALPVKCDVTDRSACSEAVKVAVERLKHLDVVILNAGISQGCYFEDIKNLDDGEYMLKVNLIGVATVLHYAFPYIPKSKDSRIVAISSVAGVLGIPFRTFYCMSKWGLNGFCNSLRTELLDAYGDNAPMVVVSCPPEVDTDINTGRLEFGAGKPAEFSKTVARPVSVAGDSILEAVKKGTRLSFFERTQQILASLYGLMPARIDTRIINMVKQTHIHPRAQSKL
eukprot:gnl/MRDRNA2_/MRDRNA2_183686_c0_seq1.p1 gnl/MRDRNA2_/MRDRNA2_183686_c0~~gnl/MRDRNA2_/MRDRNA2_183686_c0_seq1.p1  ORF type:complete len:282 (+),score=38.03 gnl/MRDRNA2_/MRDRNA2_183686_c0_seq1:57-902(+)